MTVEIISDSWWRCWWDGGPRGRGWFGMSGPLSGFDIWRVRHELDQVPDVIAVTAAGDMATPSRRRGRSAPGSGLTFPGPVSSGW
ncbi:MAG TPA: hypothetical protein VFQ68_31005 [Streptosporangiaceae bacterium]|nr:hypothetical protein [Streptosporangiaceae bacterium]